MDQFANFLLQRQAQLASKLQAPLVNQETQIVNEVSNDHFEAGPPNEADDSYRFKPQLFKVENKSIPITQRSDENENFDQFESNPGVAASFEIEPLNSYEPYDQQEALIDFNHGSMLEPSQQYIVATTEEDQQHLYTPREDLYSEDQYGEEDTDQPMITRNYIEVRGKPEESENIKSQRP